MKKLLLLLLIAPLFLSCSDDDDEKGCWEVYMVNTENIPCLKEYLKDEHPEGFISYTECESTGHEAKKLTKGLNEFFKAIYDKGEIDCLITYSYRKVEPN